MSLQLSIPPPRKNTPFRSTLERLQEWERKRCEKCSVPLMTTRCPCRTTSLFPGWQTITRRGGRREGAWWWWRSHITSQGIRSHSAAPVGYFSQDEQYSGERCPPLCLLKNSALSQGWREAEKQRQRGGSLSRFFVPGPRGGQNRQCNPLDWVWRKTHSKKKKKKRFEQRWQNRDNTTTKEPAGEVTVCGNGSETVSCFFWWCAYCVTSDPPPSPEPLRNQLTHAVRTVCLCPTLMSR